MKINIKQRLKNKTFVITMLTLIIAFVYQVLALFEVVPRFSEDTITSAGMIIVNILSALGILVDPTTEGIGDSARALTYGTDKDERRIDENTQGGGENE